MSACDFPLWGYTLAKKLSLSARVVGEVGLRMREALPAQVLFCPFVKGMGVEVEMTSLALKS